MDVHIGRCGFITNYGFLEGGSLGQLMQIKYTTGSLKMKFKAFVIFLFLLILEGIHVGDHLSNVFTHSIKYSTNQLNLCY